MRIGFGWHQFKIRSFDPYELGLTQRAANDFTIEVRQRCFYLFQLPFFGMGKQWSIRKNDQLFELPAAYKDAIRQRGEWQVPTPWYVYTGPVLLTLIGLCFVIGSRY